MNFVFQDKKGTVFTGWAEDLSSVTESVPDGLPFYILEEKMIPKTDNDEYFSPEYWSINGEPDGIGKGK